MQQGSSVGINSYIQGGTVLEANARLAPGSSAAGETIPSNHVKHFDSVTIISKDPLQAARPAAALARRWKLLAHARLLVVLLMLYANLYVASRFAFYLSLPFAIKYTLIFLSMKVLLVGYTLLFCRPAAPGRYRFWQPVVQQQYALNAAFVTVLIEYVLPDLLGTPYYNALLRRLGATIGQQVIINSHLLAEPFNLYTISNSVVINEGTRLVPHLLIGNPYGLYINKPITIGACTVIATNSLLLAGQKIDAI
jgi:hypothetical protein